MLLQAKSDFEIEDVGSVVGFFAGCVLVVFHFSGCLEMVRLVECRLQFLPRKADVRHMQFGLREVSAGKDEPPMPIGRHLMFGTLGEETLLASLDEVAETPSE